jgi:hypothetical protein
MTGAITARPYSRGEIRDIPVGRFRMPLSRVGFGDRAKPPEKPRFERQIGNRLESPTRMVGARGLTAALPIPRIVVPPAIAAALRKAAETSPVAPGLLASAGAHSEHARGPGCGGDGDERGKQEIVSAIQGGDHGPDDRSRRAG